MALPEVDNTATDAVKAEEQQAARDQALKPVETASSTEVAPVEASAGAVAVAQNASAFLGSLGIDDLQLDWTSFPTITIKDGHFNTADGDIEDSFEFTFLDKQKYFLFRIDLGKKREAVLGYSMDGAHIDGEFNDDGSPLTAAQLIEKWKKDPDYVEWEKKEYRRVLVNMVGEPFPSQIVQLQVSETSIGILDGYLFQCGTRKLDPRAIVTRAEVGPERGKGTKTFNPWKFTVIQ